MEEFPYQASSPHFTILPINLPSFHIELHGPCHHPQAAVVTSFAFFERHVEGINVSLAWALGFAWTNLLSMLLVRVPAQLAPTGNDEGDLEVGKAYQ